MPNVRTPPCGFGISTLRTASGMYSPANSACLTLAQYDPSHGLNAATVSPSTPGAALVLHHALVGAQHVAAFHHRFHQPRRFRFRSPNSRRPYLRTRSSSRQVPPAFARAGCTCVRFCLIGSHRGLLSYSRVSCSALRPYQQLLWPRLTSDDPSPRLPTPVALKQTARSPRVLRTHLPAYACRIYVTPFRARTGLCIDGPAHPAVPPLSASCSSGQRFAYSFLQIPPRDRHPCRSANTSPCRVCRGLSPPSECALPGAPNLREAIGPPFFIARTCQCASRLLGALDLFAFLRGPIRFIDLPASSQRQRIRRNFVRDARSCADVGSLANLDR